MFVQKKNGQEILLWRQDGENVSPETVSLGLVAALIRHGVAEPLE
jgi:hypothetical protein